MHKGRELPRVSPGTLMHEAILEISGKGLGCVAVCDTQDHLQGIITDGDLRRHLSPRMLELPVEEIMSTNPSTVHAQALAQEALARMNTKAITALFVVENQDSNKVVGVIHIHDCLRAGLS